MNVARQNDYDRAAAGLGRVVERGTLGDGTPWARVEFFGDMVEGGWNAARLLCRLADQDAERPEIQRLAMIARRLCSGDDQQLAEYLHAFVQERVQFAREPGERFQSAAVTLASRVGDCDDSARLLYALARAAGLGARLAFLVQDDQPAHVFCQIAHDGAYHNAEATIAALYGENPVAAAVRLGLPTRPDIGGRAVTLGALGPSLILQTGTAQPNTAFSIRNGDRVRMILDVSLLATGDAIAADFKAIGFASVVTYDDAAQLDLLEWPSDWVQGASETFDVSAGRKMMYAEGVYTGDVTALNRTLDFAKIHDVKKVLMEDASSPTGNETAAYAPPPDAKPLTAADVPALPPDPTDTDSSRSAWARAVLRNAWFQLLPTEPYNAALEQSILAIATLETNLCRSVWSDPFDASGYSLRYNFGNVHCASGAATLGQCVPGCKPHGDQTNTGAGYTTCFAAYKTAIEGMTAFLRVLCGYSDRIDTRRALLTGDATAIADAMRNHGYYGYAPPKGDATDAARDRYAAAIEGQARVVAGKLGQDVAVARGGVGGSSGIIVGVLLLAATGAGVYAAMKGG